MKRQHKIPAGSDKVGKLLGVMALGGAFLVGWLAGQKPMGSSVIASAVPPVLSVRLHRFRLKPENLPEFERWVAFEHAHHQETLMTLEREHMYVESIFRDREHDPETIYWAELLGESGASVTTSPLAIDKVYEDFMRKTLVPGSHVTLLPEYTLIPDFLTESIRTLQDAKEREQHEIKP